MFHSCSIASHLGYVIAALLQEVNEVNGLPDGQQKTIAGDRNSIGLLQNHHLYDRDGESSLFLDLLVLLSITFPDFVYLSFMSDIIHLCRLLNWLCSGNRGRFSLPVA